MTNPRVLTLVLFFKVAPFLLIVLVFSHFKSKNFHLLGRLK